MQNKTGRLKNYSREKEIGNRCRMDANDPDKNLSDGAHLSNLTSRPAALQRPRKGTKEGKEREDGEEEREEKKA